jgi:DNA repair protein RecO (recombination protein O)
LPERDPHLRLYETLAVMLEHLAEPLAAGELLVRFELMLLDDLGFGLDLEECVATGARDDLVYVSPKSGRAVSRTAGEPWRDRMLPLPAFLRGEVRRGDPAALDDAFRLTGFFFARHVYEPRALAEPEARSGFLATLRRSFANPGENAA